jgi:arabinofuranan 3-O-arabinosyltransferase
MVKTKPANPLSIERLAIVIVSSIGIGFALSLALAALRHIWIYDLKGHPIPEDFVAFWSVGQLVLHGHALAAYNAQLEHAAEVATVGRNFTYLLGWSYPPLFLFVAALLACLPFAAAFAMWTSTTAALQAGVIGGIAERPVAFLLPWAAPWAMLGLMNGQNGFLTAAIIGGVLLSLETRPALAGLLLGLLSYKPQFGLLFPVALAFGGYWRAFAWACAATIGWTALSIAAFGPDVFVAFVHSLGGAASSHLSTGEVGWNKLQSLYGLARALGVSAVMSWLLQAGLSAACVLATALVWRSGKVPFSLKAAAVAAAVPLATPYVFVYDLPVLSVAIAFLFRHRAFDLGEKLLLVAAAISVAAFVWHAYPSGLIAAGIVELIVWRRCSPVASRAQELDGYLSDGDCCAAAMVEAAELP